MESEDLERRWVKEQEILDKSFLRSWRSKIEWCLEERSVYLQSAFFLLSRKLIVRQSSGFDKVLEEYGEFFEMRSKSSCSFSHLIAFSSSFRNKNTVESEQSKVAERNVKFVRAFQKNLKQKL